MYIDASDYFRHLYKVMMSIAELGGVVVVGRGANFMLKRDQGFHVRVISSVPKRIQNLVDRDGMTYKEADEAVRKVDRERYDFVRSHFDQDIDDPRVYDMVLNMTYLDVDTALELVDRGIKAKTKIVSEIG
jgi:cytidylate kinase